ncbi:MAG: DinB family protein [Candidatus Anammoxibacter sp.]
MEYDFIIETYDTERIKTVSVWSMFKDEDLLVRPDTGNKKSRNALEQMVHQCVSENKWFLVMLGIDVCKSPLPADEIRLEFIKRYAEDSGKRLAILKEKDKSWWEHEVSFFETKRTPCRVMLRRIAHTAHHRGQLILMLKLFGRDVYSVYGPSEDTGGLPQNNAVTKYPYTNIQSLINGESKGGAKAGLPGPGDKPVTERPDVCK